MCGIAGIFHYQGQQPPDRKLLERMTAALAHRGPDAGGIHIDGPIGLGHRRLAIVDLSPAGAQPMPNRDRTSWISFNGEIYNHEPYRARLEQRGYRFRGRSDTETLLYLLESEGTDVLASLAGIFAFAYWDGRRRELTLARDPLGVKQLYFHDNGRRIVFASEIKALLQCPDVPREVDPEGVNQYLHFHTPLFERTFFKDIRQVRAGECLRFSRYGARVQRYWRVTDFTSDPGDVQKDVEELRHALAAVIREQLMSDVPVGSFFSGGIDSSAVAAYASRTGKPPRCFGVHFSGQGVPDERPYQESAARALGLDLELITADGSTFPEDMQRLMYFQDQPVIGSAMFPMYYVSRLAAREVKVCLGGQGADEIFGGYARYALVRPGAVVQSWFSGREQTHGERGGHSNTVGGNLGRQLADSKNLYRLWKTFGHLQNWEDRYFNSFAKVPPAVWQQLIGSRELFSRQNCRQMFHDTLRASGGPDPATKVMHWDVQTYLTGLFQQDDRMSMAVGLESRVPLADPRIVQLGFRTPFRLKFRGGATKWLLRQAVSDVLPEMVLNRRKVGFDTPVERWIRNLHAGFVRDTLLSSAARNRGFFTPSAVEALLAAPRSPFWIDLVWKMLSIETWAATFLDANPACTPVAYCFDAGREPRSLPEGPAAHPKPAQHLVREMQEMGPAKTLSRALWEVKTRSGLAELITALRPDGEANPGLIALSAGPVPKLFADPNDVATVMRSRVPAGSVERLVEDATAAAHGRIRCFGRWMADFGNPIDWHRNPHNGQCWAADRHWSKSLTGQPHVGDIKLVWEAGRFPHAWLMARAAVFYRDGAAEWERGLTAQVAGFVRQNPRSFGIHWNSGQEIAIRLLSWLFAANTFSRLPCGALELERTFTQELPAAADHIASHIAYARDSVYNNHLLSEALGLYLAGSLLQGGMAASWRQLGKRILTEEAESQFYPDGAYIQQSHNYHRLALQLYLTATATSRMGGEALASEWISAMERSLDFLYAHQNADGSLPNYGANDGALPCVLSTCEFADFRPVLQAASIACRGERLYPPGPWDEEAIWFFGGKCMETPLRTRERKSVSFRHTGYHVLRRDSGTFAAFRCGTILDRFSQIDMLHCDIWWRGQNVLVDPGSYLYNGPESWHRHFAGTSSHNTVTVDGQDQMVHLRKFKNIYWTEAELKRFEETEEWVLCEGEHYGYQRLARDCVHSRSVLLSKTADLCIVLDRVTGRGAHQIGLQWLGGAFPHHFTPEESRLTLETPAGPFAVTMFDAGGFPLPAAVIAGDASTPRGWLSRHYGEKVAVPSLAAKVDALLPFTAVSVLCGGGSPRVEIDGHEWRVRSRVGDLRFTLRDGELEPDALREEAECVS